MLVLRGERKKKEIQIQTISSTCKENTNRLPFFKNAEPTELPGMILTSNLKAIDLLTQVFSTRKNGCVRVLFEGVNWCLIELER